MLVLGAAACSGSPDEPPDLKPAYVEAATQICADADKQITALAPPAAPADMGPYVQSTVDVAADAQRELAALTPPPDDRAELESEVLAPLAQLVEDGEAFAARVTAAGTDQAALLALLPERPTAAGIDQEFLREYGLGSCADALGKLG